MEIREKGKWIWETPSHTRHAWTYATPLIPSKMNRNLSTFFSLFFYRNQRNLTKIEGRAYQKYKSSSVIPRNSLQPQNNHTNVFSLKHWFLQNQQNLLLIEVALAANGKHPIHFGKPYERLTRWNYRVIETFSNKRRNEIVEVLSLLVFDYVILLESERHPTNGEVYVDKCSFNCILLHKWGCDTNCIKNVRQHWNSANDIGEDDILMKNMIQSTKEQRRA